ncbi:hypothetical protein [Methanohalophilus sp.]
MITATDRTREHYLRPEVMETILNLAHDETFYRWGNGDGVGWYYRHKQGKYAYNLSREEDYRAIISKYRTLYWTLNLFDMRIFDTDYKEVFPEESPILSRQFTHGYTLGVDIDKGHGCDIHNPEVKQAVEDMGQYYADRLREYAPDSVHCLFSGGGIYVLLHHKAIEDYCKRFVTGNDWEEKFSTLLKAYGYVIEEIRKDFFKEYPQHEGKVKPDSLNNSKRVFKSLFSLHLKQPYVVIPLNPDNIKIDFEKAKLPLSNEVIESGKQWYQTYDTDNVFLNYLSEYLKLAHEQSRHCTKQGQYSKFDIETDIASDMIPYEKWPPCVKNILALEKCGEGRTRALAFIAAFLGQMGVPETKAKEIFYNLANRWGATTANVFESNFMRMHVATCDKLGADDNTGYPMGVSIRNLGVCKPDPMCNSSIPSPRYYADRKANNERLMKKLFKSN